MVRVPAVTKTPSGRYTPRKLSGALTPVLDVRAQIVAATVRSWRPDTIIIDHAPTGIDGELVPMLDHVEQLGVARPRLVLGMRDIVDDAAAIEQQWSNNSVWPAMDRFDDVFVYGDPAVTTTAKELGLDQRIRARVSHVGYAAPAMPEPQAAEPPFLLVTAGGGGDGQRVHRAVLDALDAGSVDLDVRLVTGPLMSAARQSEVMMRAANHPSVRVETFTPDLRQWIASATAVISMAGYNTVVEELAAGVASLLAPRTDLRQEQSLRAARVAEAVPHIEHVPGAAALSPEVIESFLRRARAHVPVDHPPALDLSGVYSVCDLIAGRVPVGAR